jgi:hypothetical protein
MSDAKGKGRAKVADEEKSATGADQSSPNSSSILDRVVASATGLGRSAFAAPSSNEISDTASNALANSGKGQPANTGGSSAWAEDSHRPPPQGVPSQHGQPLPAFRTGHSNEHIQSTEAEFSSFLDGIDSFTPSETVETGGIQEGRLKEERAWNNNDASHNLGQGYTSVEEQQSHDGEDVLNLLSETGTTLDTSELLPANEEAVNWNLTEEQLKILRGMLNELFPPGDAHRTPGADHPLNLVPNLASLDGEEGRQLWVEQWDGVLNRYTDEVWGDLLPLVVEAREEVQAMKDGAGTTSEQPVALRRLGLILGHIDGS